MNNTNVNFLESIFSRLDMISKILSIDFDIVLNTSLLKGISSYWHPLCAALEEYSKWELTKEVKDRRIQEIWVKLAQEITSDYLSLQEIEASQEDFDEIYPQGFFSNPTQRQEEFQKFLESLGSKDNMSEE